MATAYYSQPAAANYYTPASAHHAPQKQRGYRICDQCGAPENPSVSRFRMCGGCVRRRSPFSSLWISRTHVLIQMTTQYCSPECQKMHWSSHKPICQHTAAQLAGAKQQPVGPAYPDENLAKNLRKFTSLHSALLGWAGFQALQLKRMPANVRQQALLIDLSCNNHADPNRR